MTQDQELLFYDIEVFSHDAFVVFKDIDKNLIQVFHNDFVELAQFIKGKTLVGYNNYHYDDKILIYMLGLKSVKQIKELNDRIISGEDVSYIGKPKFDSLDVYQQLDVSKPSLKKIEGNFGRMIMESKVGFTINRPLSKEEYQLELEYCMYDVDNTIDIYKIRVKSYFEPKKQLVKMLGKEEAIKWNTTTISSNLLLNKPLPKWSGLRLDEGLIELVPEEVQEMWLNAADQPYNADFKGSKTLEAFGCDIQFAFGGLHGAHKEIKRAKKVKLLDVKSMYPNIILILNVLGHASEKYRKILEQRLAVKHSDEILSDALKLILNSVYGNLNSQYSTLYNPKGLLNVVVYGQIALYELCKRLSQFCTIININTDGVAFIPHHDNYIAAYETWQKDFSLELEEKTFELFHQKDVNNYIAANGEKLICKGGDVNRYKADALFKNNNARIVDIALVDHLIYKKDIVTTLRENLDKPHLYQYILRAGNTYQGTANDQGELLHTKVNRIFASKEEEFCLYKLRHDNGLVRFADAPTKMHLFNGNCSDIKDFEKIVDIKHYYRLVTKKLERWA